MGSKSNAYALAARRRALPGYPSSVVFNTEEELAAYLSTDKIVCLECGKGYHTMAKHLLWIHGIDPDDYRRAHGIPHSVGLASPSTRAQMARVGTPILIEANRGNTYEEYRRRGAMGAAVRTPGPYVPIARNRQAKVGKEIGIHHLRRESKLTEEDKALIAARTDLSDSELGRLLGVAGGNVARYRPPNWKNPRVRPESLSEESKRELKALKEALPDISFEELGRAFGVSRKTATRIVLGKR